MFSAMLLLILLSSSANGETLHVSDNGFITNNTITSKHKPDTVWLTLINDIGKWWPADHTYWGKSENLSIETKAGGCFCEHNGPQSVEHMHITYVDPAKLLRMSGGLGPLQGMGMYGALDWKIKQTEQGSQVDLKYSVSGINPDGFEELARIVDHVQGLQLGGLKTHLDKMK